MDVKSLFNFEVTEEVVSQQNSDGTLTLENMGV